MFLEFPQVIPVPKSGLLGIVSVPFYILSPIQQFQSTEG